MNKGTVMALAGIMIVSAAAYGQEIKKRKIEDSGFSRKPKQIASSVKVVGSEYDASTGKLKVTILTDQYCNAMSPKLVGTHANKAIWGPFHYTLLTGVSTSMACIPNIEKEKVLVMDAPRLLVKNEARLVIHGADDTFANVTLPKGYLDTASIAANAENQGEYDNSEVASDSGVAAGEPFAGTLDSNSNVSEPFVGNLDSGGGTYEAVGAH